MPLPIKNGYLSASPSSTLLGAAFPFFKSRKRKRPEKFKSDDWKNKTTSKKQSLKKLHKTLKDSLN
ncbi:MAG TPA: hypothetical protein PLO89_02030 [Spirochaetota bacterium]|nr:hypothetical protein [Spirochaetota bacterium]